MLGFILVLYVLASLFIGLFLWMIVMTIRWVAGKYIEEDYGGHCDT